MKQVTINSKQIINEMAISLRWKVEKNQCFIKACDLE